jgi:hypothetical protein
MPSNPPAFPRPAVYKTHDSYQQDECFDGMDLRDWFAGRALTGIMSDAGMRPASLSEFEHMATRMYQVADAMLAAREKATT